MNKMYFLKYRWDPFQVTMLGCYGDANNFSNVYRLKCTGVERNRRDNTATILSIDCIYVFNLDVFFFFFAPATIHHPHPPTHPHTEKHRYPTVIFYSSYYTNSIRIILKAYFQAF